MTPPFHIAQINIAKVLAPLDSPVMLDFVSALDEINALAESQEGFQWRLKEDNNNATSIKIFDDDSIIVNMSVWNDVDSLYHYVYKTAHTEYLKRRREWFEKLSEMHHAIWYIHPGHRPTLKEALDRIEYIRRHGETPYAFGFKKRFTAEELVQFEIGRNLKQI